MWFKLLYAGFETCFGRDLQYLRCWRQTHLKSRRCTILIYIVLICVICVTCALWMTEMMLSDCSAPFSPICDAMYHPWPVPNHV